MKMKIKRKLDGGDIIKFELPQDIIDELNFRVEFELLHDGVLLYVPNGTARRMALRNMDKINWGGE